MKNFYANAIKNCYTLFFKTQDRNEKIKLLNLAKFYKYCYDVER